MGCERRYLPAVRLRALIPPGPHSNAALTSRPSAPLAGSAASSKLLPPRSLPRPEVGQAGLCCGQRRPSLGMTSEFTCMTLQRDVLLNVCKGSIEALVFYHFHGTVTVPGKKRGEI